MKSQKNKPKNSFNYTRIIISILAIIFVSISTQAECYWSNFHIKCMIETTDGKIINGYLKESMCNFLNLNIDEVLLWSDNDNIEDLKKTLNQKQQWWKEIVKDNGFFTNEKDTLRYYQDRIIYEYGDSIAYYFNIKNIPIENIKTITVEKLKREASYEWISSELQLSDTTWMKKEPIKKVEFGAEWGFICSYRIFIHAKSEKVDKIVRQLELKWKEIKDIDKRQEEAENDEMERKLYGQKLDKGDEMWKIIKQLKGEKVVVISECTD